MKLRKLLATSLALLPGLCIIASSVPAAAVTVNYHDLISDAVFDDWTSMNASQIDAFLNAFPSSCISTSHGFAAQDPIGYNPTQGYLYGSNVSAGHVIADAAKAYQINPKVLLATTQKEESLVTGAGGCDTFGYSTAMGYGCPDSGTAHNYSGVNLYTLNGHTVTSVTGTCVNNIQKVGFTRQIIHAAWLLKFDRERSEGKVTWAIINGNWDNTDDLSTCYAGRMTQGNFQRCPSGPSQPYDGLSTIDGTSTHMDDGATAALYEYTPHFSGNNHFVTIFTQWFGSTIYPWAGQVTVNTYSDAAHTHALSLSSPLLSGTKIYVTVSAVNTGSQTWGSAYTRVATLTPTNRSSVFRDNSWLYYNRPARLTQGTVTPTQTGTFAFSMTAPNIDGTYHEAFGLVAEGRGWMKDTSSFSFNITVSNPYNASLKYVKAFTDSDYHRQIYNSNIALYRNMKIYLLVRAQNIGNQPWDPSYTKVATTFPTDRNSLFADGTWLSGNRPSRLDETSVGLGSIGTFGFTMTAPTTNGVYNELFGLEADGKTNGWMPNSVFGNTITVQTQPSSSLQQNQRLGLGQSIASPDGRYRLFMQTDGNMALYSQNRELWTSGTYNKGASFVVMQSDGNLVIYNHSGKAIWQSHTLKHVGSVLKVQNDGNMVIYVGSKHVWASGTNGKW